MEGRLDLADRRLDAVHAGTDPPEVCQRGDQADGAVAAHAEVATVVEEDHSGTGFGIDRCAEQGADQYVAAARFEDAGGAPGVVALAEQAPALGHVALAEIGKAVDDQAGGLAAGMRIDDADALHGGPRLCRGMRHRVAFRRDGALEGFRSGE